MIDRLVLQALIEIFILTAGIYGILRFLRNTRGFGLVRGLVTFIVVGAFFFGVLSRYPEVPVLQKILSEILPFLVMIVVILFQPELRQGISKIGRSGIFGLFSATTTDEETLSKIATAAIRMSKERVGALIAFERSVSLAPFRENAAILEAPVSTTLLENIFFPGGPLHDGAVIIRGDTILAAACIFPLTTDPTVQRRLGTRHRAARGLSEETDAITLVVSEETGHISLAAGRQLTQAVPHDQVEHKLRELLQSEKPRTEEALITQETDV
jgi:diadenylate cyclase